MSNSPLIILLIFLFILIIFFDKTKSSFFSIENFGGGALTQLYAKGPQDLYLTTNAEKYIPEYLGGYYNPYNYFRWNVPTRFNRYYYPLFGMFPYHMYY